MNESRRRQIRGWHAKHAYYCSCGRVVHGNGGKANHFGRQGHNRISAEEWKRKAEGQNK